MVYQWKIPIYSVPAQDAGEELERIKAKHHELTPDVVVDESRDSNAVLHSCFEWDDKTAAEKYRCTQAQQIIRTIVAKVEPPGCGDPVEVRAFVSIDGKYHDIKSVVDTPEMSAVMLRNALKELCDFKKKYNTLCELSAVFREIDNVLIA